MAVAVVVGVAVGVVEVRMLITTVFKKKYTRYLLLIAVLLI